MKENARIYLEILNGRSRAGLDALYQSLTSGGQRRSSATREKPDVVVSASA